MSQRDELITQFYTMLTAIVDLYERINTHKALMLDAGFTVAQLEALAQEFEDALKDEDSQP